MWDLTNVFLFLWACWPNPKPSLETGYKFWEDYLSKSREMSILPESYGLLIHSLMSFCMSFSNVDYSSLPEQKYQSPQMLKKKKNFIEV